MKGSASPRRRAGGTSPHLHFGEVSVQRVFAAIGDADAPPEARAAFQRQLGWREFAHHLLHHFPHTVERNLDPRFDDFPDQLVESRVTTTELGPWNADQSIEYFRLVMQREPDQTETQLFQVMAANRLPPGVVATAIDAIRSKERGR